MAKAFKAGPTIDQRVMDRLQEIAAVKGVVTVERVGWGELRPSSTGQLLEVKAFESIVVDVPEKSMQDSGHYTFVGLNIAIRTIKFGDEVVYDNTKNVPENLKMLTLEDSRRVRNATFGGSSEEIAAQPAEAQERRGGLLGHLKRNR